MYRISSRGHPTTGGLPAWRLGEGLRNRLLRNVTQGRILWNGLGNGKLLQLAQDRDQRLDLMNTCLKLWVP